MAQILAGLIVVLLPLVLLVSGRKSDAKTSAFYRSYFSQEELKRLGRTPDGRQGHEKHQRV